MKRVNSTDSRKAAVVRAFRDLNMGASKVTDVMDLGNGMFRATLHRHLGNRKYERLGVFETPVLFYAGERDGTGVKEG